MLPINDDLAEADFRNFVNANEGTVDRRIYSDERIYQLELERIFARAWNFMCHESQVPKTGDFFQSYIGEDAVIAVRDKSGAVNVLLNTCRHRGNAVCRAEQGNARAFLCTYHGWTYGLDGKLVGVPGYKELYNEELDRDQWGLIRAKVASYKGFYFATMDPDAPDLADYLGETGRIGLDFMAARGPLEVVDGVCKYVIGCNWKLPTDNVPDWYHAPVTHGSSYKTGGFPAIKRVNGKQISEDYVATAATSLNRTILTTQQRVVFGRYGHFIGGPRITDEVHERLIEDPYADAPEMLNDIHWRYQPDALAQLGPVGIQTLGHANVFPNLWVADNGLRLCLRIPRGVAKTEMWWFTLLDKSISEADRVPWIHKANHVFGPAGLFEQEDGENWDQATRATRGFVSRQYPFHFGMNRGHGKVQRKADRGSTFVDTHQSEHAQLWLYQGWSDWMTAKNWDELEHIARPIPDTVV